MIKRAAILALTGLALPVLAADEKLDTLEQKVSYILGYDMGKRMTQDDAFINVDILVEAIRDGVDGKDHPISEEDRRAIMAEFQQKMQAEAQAAQAKAGAANKEEGAAFLAENGKKEGVITTDSGLQYQVIEEGEGDKPSATDQVKVHYTGTLLNGDVFDSSVQRGEPVTFGLNQVIKGWTEGLQLMSPGAKYKLFIPSDLAYGPRGAGQMIGPDATLIFDVELISIEK